MEYLGNYNVGKAREKMVKSTIVWGEATLDACRSMREKAARVALGKSKVEWQTFRDPSRPGAFIRVKIEKIDDEVRTSFVMDDSKVWAECKKMREADQLAKDSGAKYTGCAAQWFICTFLLEAYFLLKYGIDLRGNDWMDPRSEEGRKVSWIMDRDPFASRYKTINGMESRGMSDPFAKKFRMQ